MLTLGIILVPFIVCGYVGECIERRNAYWARRLSERERAGARR